MMWCTGIELATRMWLMWKMWLNERNGDLILNKMEMVETVRTMYVIFFKAGSRCIISGSKMMKKND